MTLSTASLDFIKTEKFERFNLFSSVFCHLLEVSVVNSGTNPRQIVSVIKLSLSPSLSTEDEAGAVLHLPSILIQVYTYQVF
jgi:hypothetical protein